MPTHDEYLAIKERAAAQFLQLPGVHAVGLARKQVTGVRTAVFSLRITVIKKLGQVPANEMIPATFEGIPTDVVEAPIPTICVDPVPGIRGGSSPDTTRHRPLRGGTQINRTGQGFGTLGFFFRVTGSPNRILAVTNHHVLFGSCGDALGTDLTAGQATDTDSCTQCCKSRIGTIVAAKCNAKLDVALVELSGSLEWLAEVETAGVVAGTHDLTIAEANTNAYQVRKRGRTTRWTGGWVDEIAQSGSIHKHDGTVHRTYTNGIIVVPNPDPTAPTEAVDFVRGGDSGSALLNTDRQVVGLVFGQSGHNGLALPIKDIIDGFATDGLNLTVATATTPNSVQTVPADSSGPSGLLGDDAGIAARLERDLAATATGRWYTQVYLQHLPELNTLINTNRRVATRWHRSGAAALFQAAARAVAQEGVEVPEQINGHSPTEILLTMKAVLERYGSEALRHDLARLPKQIPDFAGCTYNAFITMLGDPDLRGVSAA
jgi:hypothetical protein